MLTFLRLFLHDMRDDFGRFRFWFFLTRNLPGQGGFYIRKRLLSNKFKSVGDNLVIHVGVKVRNFDKMEIGNNVELGAETFYQALGGLVIGDNTIIGPGTKIWTINHKFDDPDTPIMKQGCQYKKVVIGNNVWIGANAFIMPGAHIGDGCVISAGSVVGGKHIAPYSILAGNPARVIGKRDQHPDSHHTVSHG